MLQKEVPFFIKILHLSSPDQDLSLMGCRGYLTKSAVLCCRSSLTGDFCKCSQWAEALPFLLCQTGTFCWWQNTSPWIFLTKNTSGFFFLFWPSCVAQWTKRSLIGKYLASAKVEWTVLMVDRKMDLLTVLSGSSKTLFPFLLCFFNCGAIVFAPP